MDTITAIQNLIAPVVMAADAAGGHGAHGGEAGPWYLAWIPFIPLVGAAIVATLTATGNKDKTPAYMSVVLLAISFAITVSHFMNWGGTPVTIHASDWISFSWGDGPGQSFTGNFSFYFDGLSLLWMLFVTGLATMICLYASEYMSHDVGPGYGRFFFAFMLFVFSMSCLVMGDNLLLLFLGWEGVGLCSYLLIGYFYKKKAAVDAGQKAFVVNRIGDLGLLMGLLLTFTTFGTIEYEPLFAMIEAGETASGARLANTWQSWAIPLLLIGGAFGKSAQLFFYVWLPDAMEGPTPVSALIHAATMVTAGVYLVARMMPLFLADEDRIALTVVAWGGAITAFWAATIAMAQFDIKRIMGYSTISQLGYMFAGLGFLSSTGAVFHVFTHAFFKATLFLACGAVMHGFAGQLDMRKLSGIRKLNGWKITSFAMLIGCLNLAGFPFTAGYFSKDQILAEAFYTPDSVVWGSSWAGWLLLLTAGLTAYYTFRVFFRVFVGPTIFEPGDEAHGDDGDGHDHADDHETHGFHPHAPGWAMNLVLVVLASGSILAAGLYFVNKKDHGWAGSMVHQSSAYVHGATWIDHGGPYDAAGTESGPEDGTDADTSEAVADGGAEAEAPIGDYSEAGHAGGADHAAPLALTYGEVTEPGKLLGFDPHEVMYYVSAVFGAVGILCAAYFHGPRGFEGLMIGARERADTVRMNGVAIKPVNRWAERKWFVDEFYHLVIVMPLRVVSHLFHWFDKIIIDIGLVDTLGRIPGWAASVLRVSQSGFMHGYAIRMIGGVALAAIVAAILALK
ncbi:MAG: NADH-quinone oxidoreductase subunit L [Planctomycetota bacterium]